jgi:biotin transport system substrate-specific component
MLSARFDSPLSVLARRAALVLAGSGLMYLSAQVAIPASVAWGVPITLQTLAIPVLVALLGREVGTLAVLAYLAEGIAGWPVFAGHAFGLVTLLGPSGGFLVGFPIAAYLIGTFYHDGFARGYFRRLIAIAAGTAAVFVAGVLWLALGFTHDLGTALAVGVLPFLAGDAAKCVIAAAIPARAFR